MTASAPPAPTAQNWLSIAILGVIWGGTFMVVSIALEGYGPVTVACARTSLGALAMAALMVALRCPLPREGWGLLAVIGLFNTALPFFLLSWGLQYVPSAFGGISMAALPLLVLPLAHFFSDEPMHLRRAIGVAVGFCGALVLIGPGALDPGSQPLAELACLTAAFSYAIASILTRRAPKMNTISMAAVTLGYGSLILIPIMLLTEGAPGWAGARPGLAILFLGLVPTAFAALLRIQVIRSAGSVFMTVVNYQVPLWSMLFGATILGEDLPWRFFAALALILAGLGISQWNSLRRALRHARPD